MRRLTVIAMTLAALAIPALASAHCQIPCGIYDDSLRMALVLEDITTIEKSMQSIIDMSAAADKNYNQIVRWVTNKDDHADKLIETVTQYFMAQRVKPADPADTQANAAYTAKLTVLHKMLVTAMQCKQTTDKANCEKLRKLAAEFDDLYFDGGVKK